MASVEVKIDVKGAMQGPQPSQVRRLQEEYQIASWCPLLSLAMNPQCLDVLPLLASCHALDQIIGGPMPACQAHVANRLQGQHLLAVVEEVLQVQMDVLDEAASEAHLLE